MASGLRPGLRALRAHDGRALRSDLIAGITVAAFLVPQVLAYAGVAGLPAVTGLWAATAALGCYALLGSSRQLSLGPESTTALLTASTVGPLAAGDPHRYAAIAAALAIWSAPSACWAGWLDSASWPTCCPARCWSAT
jgi:sulfate permease, SulP family